MKVKDRELKLLVEVCAPDCVTRPCYWPRPDPGVYVQGQGYRTRHPEAVPRVWLCGTREIRGCPPQAGRQDEAPPTPGADPDDDRGR